MALSKITNLSITDDAVRTVGIQDDNITTAKILDNNVTLAKLGDGTQGDILYYGASGAPARLGFGTSGDFLKTQGTGANPAWATATGSGKIGQVIAASASPNAVQIDSPSAYTQLTDGSTALVASITPSATSSNVFVMCNIQSTFNDEEGYGVSLRRAGVQFFASATTQDIWCQSWDGSRSTRDAWFAIDTGISTTSATEYSVYVKTYADSATYFQYLDNPSQLILMEILA